MKRNRLEPRSSTDASLPAAVPARRGTEHASAGSSPDASPRPRPSVKTIASGPRTRTLLAALLLAAISIAPFVAALPYPFVLDDVAAVSENPDAAWPPDLSAIFSHNYWGDRPGYRQLTIYRPLATLTFSLTNGLSASPFAHRLPNLLLHAACTLLVFALGLSLTRSTGPSHDRKGVGQLGPGAGTAACSPPEATDNAQTGPPAILIPFAAALLFAVHPVHVEVVVGVVSRCELLAALFVLLGSWLYLSDAKRLRFRPLRNALVAAAFALALLSKENGMTLVAVILGIQLAQTIHHRWSTGRFAGLSLDWSIHAWLFPVLVGYLALRAAVLPALLGGDVPVTDNPMVGADLTGRILTPFRVFIEYARLLVAPVNLTIDYSLNHVPATASWTDLPSLAGLLLFLLLLAGALRALHSFPAVGLALLGFFATYSVVSNLLFPSTIIMAERLIYLPSAFLLLALSGLAAAALPRDAAAWKQWTAGIGFLLVAGLFAAGSIERGADWQSPYSLFAAAVRVAPDSAKSQHLLANELAAQQRHEDALPHFEAAVAIAPQSFTVRTNYARSLALLGRFDEALPQLKEALTLSPGYPPAMQVVCAIWERTGQPPGARRACRH